LVLGDATLGFVAIGDFGAPVERVRVDLGGQEIGQVFTYDGNDCPREPDTDELLVAPALLQQLAPDGQAQITMTVLPGGFAACPEDSFIQVSLSYPTIDRRVDADGDFVPDHCDCPADVDGSATVDVDDLIAVVLGWGGDGAADVDGSGAVDVDDLVLVVLEWGPCR
jgi:hypothetical protein